MIGLRIFSYNFAYTIMSKRHTVLKESKQSFYSMKNPQIINLKGKLQKAFDFILRCQTTRIWFAHLLVEIPRGFELLKPYMELLIGPTRTSCNRKWRNCRKVVVALNDS